MIDDMVATVKKEQKGDEHNKEYCAMQLDLSDDKKKTVLCALPNAETAIENAKQGIATLMEEIAALETSIKDLEKGVTEGTDQ